MSRGSTLFLQRHTHRWACCLVLAAERGPSAGKEWFWLRGNPKLAPSHLLPDFAAGSSSSNSSGPQFQGSWHTSGSRLWDAGNGMWWEEGWKLGAVCLHSWPAHREKLRALAVDPWERLLVTAGEEDNVAPPLQVDNCSTGYSLSKIQVAQHTHPVELCMLCAFQQLVRP